MVPEGKEFEDEEGGAYGSSDDGRESLANVITSLSKKSDVHLTKKDGHSTANILQISVIMVIIAVLWIIMMLLCAVDFIAGAKHITGYVAVVGASFVFGSTGIPMKSPSLAHSALDPSDITNPLIFALYTSLGIFVVNLPVLIYLLSLNSFRPAYWALLGSADIIVINIAAFKAVQAMGYAKAPAVWCSVGMATAFVIGAIGFKEEVQNAVYGGLAIPTLTIGVVMVLLSQSCVITLPRLLLRPSESIHSKLPVTAVEEATEESKHGQNSGDTRENDTNLTQRDSETLDSVTMSPLQVEGPDDPASSTASDQGKQETLSRGLSISVLFCLLTGVLDGSLMVPYKLTQSRSLNETFSYLASFGVSALLIVVVLLPVLHCTTRSKDAFQRQMSVALAPGLCSGMLWAAANFMSVHATEYLGMRVGFPLTQTCVVFAAMWGVLYFKEIDIRRTVTVGMLCLGIGCVILGSFFLAESGSR